MGFKDDEIGLLTHDDDGDADIRTFKEMVTNKAGSGAATGALAGAGGGALWAVGVAAGIIPAIGPVIAGGVLAVVAVSASAGASSGAFLGTLVGLGIDDEESAYYDEEFRQGRTIVLVKAAGRTLEAYTTLQKHNSKNKYATTYMNVTPALEKAASTTDHF